MLMADIEQWLYRVLVAAIKATITVMGVPNSLLRPCAMSVNTVQILLGLPGNTYNMTVGITLQCRLQIIRLLYTVGHKDRESFTIGDLELLIGNIGRVDQGFRPVFT